MVQPETGFELAIREFSLTTGYKNYLKLFRLFELKRDIRSPDPTLLKTIAVSLFKSITYTLKFGSTNCRLSVSKTPQLFKPMLLCIILSNSLRRRRDSSIHYYWIALNLGVGKKCLLSSRSIADNAVMS